MFTHNGFDLHIDHTKRGLILTTVLMETAQRSFFENDQQHKLCRITYPRCDNCDAHEKQTYLVIRLGII